jgi:hypothetical protein
MSSYMLVFDGTISEGFQVEDVKKNLETVLKANQKQIERLFSKPEVVIKKNVDYESAMKYQKAMQKAGTICKVMELAQSQVTVPVEKATPVDTNTGFIDQPAAPSPAPRAQDHHFPRDPVMDIGETTLPKDFHNPAAAAEETREPIENKIGRGIGDIIAGVILIGIGLVWGGSIFLGTADALDVFFDGLGIFWIVKGIYKMIR